MLKQLVIFNRRIDCCLLNGQWQMVHTFHTAQEQVQKKVKIYWNGGWMGNLATPFDCPGIMRRDVKRTIYLVFCSAYTAPIVFSKSTKEVSNVQGAWRTPNTLPNMVHGHAFLIIWQPAPREYTYPSPGNALCIGTLNIHLYLERCYVKSRSTTIIYNVTSIYNAQYIVESATFEGIGKNW